MISMRRSHVITTKCTCSVWIMWVRISDFGTFTNLLCSDWLFYFFTCAIVSTLSFEPRPDRFSLTTKANCAFRNQSTHIHSIIRAWSKRVSKSTQDRLLDWIPHILADIACSWVGFSMCCSFSDKQVSYPGVWVETTSIGRSYRTVMQNSASDHASMHCITRLISVSDIGHEMVGSEENSHEYMPL